MSLFKRVIGKLSIRKADAPAAATGGVAVVPLGSKENPIRCAMVAGERAYVSRLRDQHNREIEATRLGSFGVGPYGNVLDGYSISSAGSPPATVYFDMYHLGYSEEQPVPGFKIVS